MYVGPSFTTSPARRYPTHEKQCNAIGCQEHCAGPAFPSRRAVASSTTGIFLATLLFANTTIYSRLTPRTSPCKISPPKFTSHPPYVHSPLPNSVGKAGFKREAKTGQRKPGNRTTQTHGPHHGPVKNNPRGQRPTPQGDRKQKIQNTTQRQPEHTKKRKSPLLNWGPDSEFGLQC